MIFFDQRLAYLLCIFQYKLVNIFLFWSEDLSREYGLPDSVATTLCF